MKKTILLIVLFISIISVCIAKTKYIPIIIVNNNKPAQTATPAVVLPAVLPTVEEPQTATPSWLIATPTNDIGGNQ